MFLAWGSGACLYCAPEGSLAGIGEFIRRCGLTFWLSVPATAAFMRQMRMLKPGSYPTLRWSLFCGEALPMGLARAWQSAAPNSIVENLYGPTEATVAFTAYRLPKEPCAELDALQTVPIGTPLPGQKVMVIDDNGNPLPDGDVGELCLGGSQVASGYWRAPDQTAERFRSPQMRDAAGTRWYRTGDLAVMTREHGLVFRGRIDRQAKIRGYRVELLEVENAMRVAAGTDTVAVVPWPIGDAGLANGLVGFVAGSQTSAAEVIDRCRDLLPAYMVPSRIFLSPIGRSMPMARPITNRWAAFSKTQMADLMSKSDLIRSTVLAMLPAGTRAVGAWRQHRCFDPAARGRADRLDALAGHHPRGRDPLRRPIQPRAHRFRDRRYAGRPDRAHSILRARDAGAQQDCWTS